MQHHHLRLGQSKRGFMRRAMAVACLAAATMTAMAQASADSVKLTFSGATTASIANSVPSGITVTASNSAVTATLTQVNFNAFQTNNVCASGDILGPASYDNTKGSTIEYTFQINGLNAVLPQFNDISVGVCGLNSQGNYQNSNNDPEGRQFNFTVAYGESEPSTTLGTTSGDLMINAFHDGQNYQLFPITSAAAVTTTSPLYVKVTLTHNADKGCYAGLKDLVIKYVEAGDEPTPTPDPDPEPDPEPEDTTSGFSAKKYYKFYNYGNHSLYMGADASGNLMVMSNDPANRIYWQFESTGKENCYYVKNAATGQYIQQLKAKGAQSYITMGDAPVEYYVGQNTRAKNGAYWFSSTNTTGYSTESSSCLALNKDGASTHVLTWVADNADNNSYWFVAETTYDYDPTPFTPTNEANGQHNYFIKSASSSKAFDGSKWADQTQAKDQQWYFAGTNNKSGGYQIFNAASGQPLDTLHYVVEQTANGYAFRHASEPKDLLTLAGETSFFFEAARSSFSLAEQIYNMDCGTLANPLVQTASLKGDGVRTPLVCERGDIATQGANTVWTKSRPVLVGGKDGTLTITLNQAPSAEVQAYLYFDWDRDGFFEKAIALTAGQTITQQLSFPAIDGTTAKAGQSHMRLRLTTNGLSGAEDDVIGQSIDFIITLTDDAADFKATARPNDPARGTATVSGTTATATTKGHNTFVCWKEQNKVVSTDPTYNFTLDHDVDLVAVFSPATDWVSAIGTVQAQDHGIAINVSGNTVVATAPTAVKSIHVYSPNGSLVATAKGGKLSMQGKPAGVYIAKARTGKGEAAVKFQLQ